MSKDSGMPFYKCRRSENLNTFSGYEKETICEFCKYDKTDSNKKPCNTCVQWVDGYLTVTNYENNPSASEMYTE